VLRCCNADPLDYSSRRFFRDSRSCVRLSGHSQQLYYRSAIAMMLLDAHETVAMGLCKSRRAGVVEGVKTRSGEWRRQDRPKTTQKGAGQSKATVPRRTASREDGLCSPRSIFSKNNDARFVLGGKGKPTTEKVGSCMRRLLISPIRAQHQKQTGYC
jgi:hypothetical protein